MYESFYNLSAGPFQLMPDPRFLFRSEGHKRALSYLLYGLQRREGFVVITGDVGIGKTLLVQTLIDEIGGRNLSVVRVAMANLDADGVLPMVASAFGLAHESRSKVGLLNDLVAKILPTYNRGALLIVDEAQTCTPAALEELRAISNLQAHGRALLQVFLVGQSELRSTLADPSMEQLRQRVITSYHLRPLDVDELRNYVQHRLTAAGWQADPELSDAIYPHVHTWTAGVPRRINLLMDRLLLYGYLEELHRLDETDVQVVIQELDAEQAEQGIALPAKQPDPALSLSSPEGEALQERIKAIEQAFTAAVGETRAQQLLDRHEASAQQKAMLALNMRLARLESLLADQTALQVLRQPQQTSATHEASQDASAAQQPEQAQQPTDPQQAEAAGQTQTAEHAESSAQTTAPASEQRAQPPYEPRQPEPAAMVPKWRLFSRRK